MKTRITALAAAALMALPLFTGCSANTDVQTPTDVTTIDNTPAGGDAAITPQPTDAAAIEGIAIEGVQFDENTQSFFGGDAAAAIQTMAPMLTGAAGAWNELKTDYAVQEGKAPDAAFQWKAIYLLLDDFGSINPAVTVNADETLSVPAAEMEKYFGSAFAAPVPQMAGDAGIAYDDAAKTYTVTGSDRSPTGYAVSAVSIGENGAALTISIRDLATDTVVGNALVEVVANPGSMFGYSIKSVTAGAPAVEAPAASEAPEASETPEASQTPAE